MNDTFPASKGVLRDQNQLLSFLSRAVTLTNGAASPCINDDLRMLKRIRPAFIGRSAYVWVTRENDNAHLLAATHWAERVHAEVDTDIVLQAGIFEAVYPAVESIAIPAEVFEALDEPVESRKFCYADMIGRVQRPDQGVAGGPWDGGDVPDLSRPEAMRWFVYRALRYLQAGYEALHLGQMHLICGADPSLACAVRLCRVLRKLATRYARRGWVLLDTHGNGMAVDGNLLFDFTSRPMSARGLENHPPHIALLKRGDAVGGHHPGGWHCDTAPVLVEIDNWGGYSLPPGAPEWNDPHRLASIGRWGYDEISWFARLDQAQRSGFLRYAHRWVRHENANWFFQPPLSRLLADAAFERNTLHIDYYRANDASEACPDGFGDEEVLTALWQIPAPFPEPPSVANPVTRDGVTVTEPVSILGNLQALVGGIPGDASCPWSRLIHRGGGMFERSWVLPLAGDFTFSIAVGGAQADLINQGGISGGAPFQIKVRRSGDAVRICFNASTRTVTLESDAQERNYSGGASQNG